MRGAKLRFKKTAYRFLQSAFCNVFVLIILVLFISQDTATAESTSSINLNNEGVKALNAGDYDLAIRKFEAALDQDPDYKLVIDNLAIAHNNSGLQLQTLHPDLALKQFHAAMYLNSSNSTTKANIEVLIRKLKKNPKSFDDRVELAEVARREGDLPGAVVEYIEALKIKDNAETHARLSQMYKILHKDESTVPELKDLAGKGDSADNEVKLGEAYIAKSDMPSAITCFQKAIDLHSDKPETLEALKYGWEKLINNDPLDPQRHIGLGQTLQILGHFDQARAEYKQAISIAGSRSRFTDTAARAKAQLLLEAMLEVEKSFNSKKINARTMDESGSK